MLLSLRWKLVNSNETRFKVQIQTDSQTFHEQFSLIEILFIKFKFF